MSTNHGVIAIDVIYLSLKCCCKTKKRENVEDETRAKKAEQRWWWWWWWRSWLVSFRHNNKDIYIYICIYICIYQSASHPFGECCCVHIYLIPLSLQRRAYRSSEKASSKTSPIFLLLLLTNHKTTHYYTHSERVSLSLQIP